MRSLRFCLSTLLAAACLPTHASNYIVGGEDVLPKDPLQSSTVGIFEPSGDGHTGSLCTGTLIRKNMVLTAAHCVSGGVNPAVIFGRDLHAPTAVHRTADAVAVNPTWNKKAGKGMDQGDIALVKFPGGLPPGYKKIPLVQKDEEIHRGGKVILAGYGISDAGKKTGAGKLRRTEVSIAKNRRGKSEMILDQTRGHGACHGDSGGPAFINSGGKLRVAGVTNRSYPNRAPDDCAHKSVYTKTPAYKSWIGKTERKLNTIPPQVSPAQLQHRQRLTHHRYHAHHPGKEIARQH
jgi:hypothetical protein